MLVATTLAACTPPTTMTADASLDGPDGDGAPDATTMRTDEGSSDATEHEPYVASMDFSPSAPSFYSAPFPSEHLRRSDGTIDLTRFPNPRRVAYAQTLIDLAARSTDGFGLLSSVYFQLGGEPDPAVLPDFARSLEPTAAAFLISVDPDAPDRGRRYPVTVTYQADAGPYGARRLLAMRPLQGVPLRPHTRYAAVLLRTLRSRAGAPLEPSEALTSLLAARAPSGLSSEALTQYRAALDELGRLGVAGSTLGAIAVFRTHDPTAGLYRAHARLRAQLSAGARLQLIEQPSYVESFGGYCVFRATVRAPVFQRGTAPYSSDGGDWALDRDGTPLRQRDETARLFLTIPRASTMPSAGYPLAVFVRTGGGGDRPLIDRGPHATNGGPALEPGSGPAREFASAGFAGASLDGPLGGMRNPTGGDEQLLIFNFSNPVAMRDNLRQSALELAMLPELLASMQFSVTACDGAQTPDGGPARFDLSRLALMGHSMGATIAPLALALAPEYRAVVLSGAGGSWIENVVHKRKPVPVRPLADLLVNYTGTGRTLREDDPILSVLQWAGEPADPPVYARALGPEPRDGESARHVLMLQGIVDRYILPPIANALALPLGVDLGGDSLDARTPETMSYLPMERALGFVGRTARSLPLRDNAATGATASTRVVVQFAEDMIEDGHEVAFQREEARRIYRCFLRTFSTGRGSTPSRGPLVLDTRSTECEP